MIWGITWGALLGYCFAVATVLGAMAQWKQLAMLRRLISVYPSDTLGVLSERNEVTLADMKTAGLSDTDAGLLLEAFRNEES